MRTAVLALLAAGNAVFSSGAIYLVRHAERPSIAANPDPSLSGAGRRRARDLARTLAGVPLKAVYVTEFRRTQETAAPAAKAAGLALTRTEAEKTEALAAALRRRGVREDVLVVGHSDTLPDILTGLGVREPVAISEESDYDNLFVVDLAGGAAKLQRRRYGVKAHAADPGGKGGTN